MNRPSPDETSNPTDGPSASRPGALHDLMPIVYDELRSAAAILLQRERGNITLQPTALVNEVFLRLAQQRTIGVDRRNDFLAIAAMVMRRVLVDHARSKRREKRGGDAVLMTLDSAVTLFEDASADLGDVDAALQELADIDPRKAQLVELRFFAGLTMAEAARVIGTPLRTAERDWRFARAWLRERLG